VIKVVGATQIQRTMGAGNSEETTEEEEEERGGDAERQ